MDTETKPGETNPPRDAAYWARPVERLRVAAAPGAYAGTVNGRQAVSPIQGFGQMWQKTYRVRLTGAGVTPQQVIAVWKEHFPEFWPAGNRFYTPLSGIKPGEVALLGMAMPGRITFSTGVMVLYADEESFTLMTPQGHTFAGWITFSAHEDAGETVAQAVVLIRASDPIVELGLMLFGHKQEDAFWQHTLRSLAIYFGVDAPVETQIICVDRVRQWKRVGNVRHNAMFRSMLYQARATPRAIARQPAGDRGRRDG